LNRNKNLICFFYLLELGFLSFLFLTPGCNTGNDSEQSSFAVQDSIIWYKQATVELGNRIEMFDVNSGMAISRGKGNDVPGVFYFYKNFKWDTVFSFNYSDFPLISKYNSDSLWFIIHETHHGYYRPRHFVYSDSIVTEISLPLIMWDETDHVMWKGLSVLPDGTAWMVGQQGRILFFNKQKWIEYQSPVKRQAEDNLNYGDLNDVFMLSSQSGWAVGRDGIILRFNGKDWERNTSPTNTQLNKIFMVDESHGWIVGLRGTLLEFNGSEWNRVNLPTRENLYTVKAESKNSVWIAGNKSTLFEYNGIEWVPINSVRTYIDEFWDLDISTDNFGNRYFWIIGNSGIYTNFQSLNFSFTDITSQAALPREGIAGFFLNTDNNFYPDLFIIGEESHSKMFQNKKSFFLEKVYSGINSESEPTTRLFSGGDVNNDGYNDLLEIRMDGSIKLLKGEGNGDFSFYSDLSGISLGYIEPNTSISVNFVDLNNDGNIDIYISNFNNDDILLSNDGIGNFANVYPNSGITKILNHESFGANFSDFNNDGFVDLLLTYKFTDSDKHIDLFINKGDFRFESKDDPGFYSSVSPVSYASVAVDLNNDLFTDIVIHNNKLPTKILLNNGNASFLDVSEELGFSKLLFHPAPSNGVLVAEDFNNDGWIDLFISSRLFLNNNGKHFTDVTEQTGISFVGDPSTTDIDNDGDIDLFIGSSKIALGEGIRTTLYRNNLNDGNFIKVKLLPDLSNRSGIGTKVILTQRDSSGDITNQYLRECGLGSNPFIQKDFSTINFAAPKGGNYSLKVVFPSGAEQIVENVLRGNTVMIKESNFFLHSWFLFARSVDRMIKTLDFQTELIKLVVLFVILYFMSVLAEKRKYNVALRKHTFILSLLPLYLILLYFYSDLPLFSLVVATFFPVLLIGFLFITISHKVIEKRQSRFISHYKLIDVLGMGGMGKVYKAIDVNSKTVVAVKVINPEILKSDENKKRITDEGRILTSLNHPNIVRVFEIGETEETGYVAMEYLPGGTLYEYIKNNSPLPFETIKEYLLQICSGLEEIHSKNIIHRDLKSSNIMIDKNGIIRIMDFGLSKSPLIATMTSLGTALGTLGYVAPEQITNSNVDNRTDIFSLGVILYELITNDLPFKGENEIAMIHSIFNSNPLNPCELNPHIPNFVGEIVLKCIDKNSENRYSSVTGIINDINNN
jgi:hypothetical protein